jgi:Terminase small subunit
MEMLAEFKFAPTEQEVLFARCLARESDYAKAWLDAGYEDLGHTKNYTRGIRLAKKKKISERLEFFKTELIQKADIKDYEVIGELKAIALSNAADFINDEDGELIDFRDLTRSQMAAVKRIKVTQTEVGVTREVFFHDKPQALEKLAKMLNLYERNNQANAPKIILNLGKQETVNVIDVSEG